MTRLRALLAIPALVAGISAPAAAEVRGAVSPRVSDLVTGLFCAPEEAERRPAPGTIAGWVHISAEPIVMRVETDVAPMVLGTGFGVSYMLNGEGLVTLRYTVVHPPIPPSNMTTETWTSQQLAGESDSFFFQFDTPQEMQPGEWLLSAEADGEPLFTVAVTVLPASDLPELAHLCRSGDLLSLSRTDPSAAG